MTLPCKHIRLTRSKFYTAHTSGLVKWLSQGSLFLSLWRHLQQKKTVHCFKNKRVEEHVWDSSSAISSLGEPPLLGGGKRLTNGAACDLNSWRECCHRHTVRNIHNATKARAFISGPHHTGSITVVLPHSAIDSDWTNVYLSKNLWGSFRLTP